MATPSPLLISVSRELRAILFRVLDQPRCSSPWVCPPLRDLPGHEARGGHTTSLHVGQSLDQLRGRLASVRGLSVVSSFWNEEAAKATVSYLTSANLDRIIHWACGTGGRLVVQGYLPTRSSIGYALFRGGDALEFCRAARMILQRMPGPDLFHILTAYPEL